MLSILLQGIGMALLGISAIALLGFGLYQLVLGAIAAWRAEVS